MSTTPIPGLERVLFTEEQIDDRIREVELWDLVSALGRVMQKKEVVGSTSLRREEIPVAELVKRIGDRVRRERESGKN